MKLVEACQQLRRRLVARAQLNPRTGKRSVILREWETKPCGAPLFNPADQQRGTCRSCAGGWKHPYNYPVES